MCPQLNKIRQFIKIMRPNHWIKNGFVFAPLIFSGGFVELTLVYKSFIAALLFCVASSAAYIFNDIHDLEHDRQHPTKSARPLTSGNLSISSAWLLLVIICTVLFLSVFFTSNIIYVLFLYLGLNVAYTLALKNQPVLDIFIIAIFFVLRVVAGAVSLDIVVSPWMAITTISLALYLATIKRQKEFKSTASSQTRRVLKKYTLSLLGSYANTAMTGSLIFYSLFVMSARTQLALTIPFVLFGIFRYQYIVEKLDMGESPPDTLLKDWQLLLTIVLWVILCIYFLWPTYCLNPLFFAPCNNGV